jgi:hypothetical protein
LRSCHIALMSEQTRYSVSGLQPAQAVQRKG